MSRAAPVIAIDGPSASGKGTVAARVAEALGFRYLDSGALYRLVALAAAHQRVGLTDEPGLAHVGDTMDVEFGVDGVKLGGHRVDDALRSEEIGVAASQVASLPGVRQALLRRQRAFRQAPGLVADGRDMGSIVFPDAPLKVFLTADVETRARRRYKQLMEKGMYAKLADVVEELRRRDERDTSRAVAPLKHYPDAVFLDTTAVSIDQAVETILHWWREKARGEGIPSDGA